MARMKQLCADLAKIKEIVDGMYDHDLRSRLQHVVTEAERIKEELHAECAADVVRLTAQLQQANEIRAFVERIRDDWRKDAHMHQAEVASVKQDNETKARANAQLAAEVARLHETKVYKELQVIDAALQAAYTERDALRAKLEKVRKLLDGDAGALHVVALIDGEGDK